MLSRSLIVVLLSMSGLAGCAAAPPPADPTVAGHAAMKLRGEHGYVAAFRREGAIVVGAMAPDRSPLGGLVTLSHAAQESEPIVTPAGEGALVAWSERDHDGEPWRVRLVRFIPGAGMASLDEQTARSRRELAPKLAWARDESGLDLVRVDDTTTIALAGAQ